MQPIEHRKGGEEVCKGSCYAPHRSRCWWGLGRCWKPPGPGVGARPEAGLSLTWCIVWPFPGGVTLTGETKELGLGVPPRRTVVQ
jgi:hypothetical protein